MWRSMLPLSSEGCVSRMSAVEEGRPLISGPRAMAPSKAAEIPCSGVSADWDAGMSLAAIRQEEV